MYIYIIYPICLSENYATLMQYSTSAYFLWSKNLTKRMIHVMRINLFLSIIIIIIFAITTSFSFNISIITAQHTSCEVRIRQRGRYIW